MTHNEKIAAGITRNDRRYWRAVLRKDRSQDGRFFFGVATTGIYCCPSCPSRRPLRKNVRFYLTPDEAERDGLRACLRCRPRTLRNTGPDAEWVGAFCDRIRRNVESEEPVTLQKLSLQAGVSPFQLHRRFKAITGITPHRFVEACRMSVLREKLRAQQPVTDAIYAAGFGSSSRVYERADTRMGMTPARYRAGGKGLAISYVCVKSPVGLMMIGATDRGLCSLQFGKSQTELVASLGREYPAAWIEPMERPYPPQFTLWMRSLFNHLRGQQPRLDVPVEIRATAFQLKVWTYLQSIPYGSTASYSEVAKAIGHPRSARAIARACAQNRVGIVIPCHRVIRGDGGLGGYRWGLARKRVLIDRERASKQVALQSGAK